MPSPLRMHTHEHCGNAFVAAVEVASGKMLWMGRYEPWNEMACNGGNYVYSGGYIAVTVTPWHQWCLGWGERLHSQAVLV